MSEETSSPRFLETAGKMRSEMVHLDWPIEVGGKVWTEIEVRRVTTKELEAYLNSPEGTPPPNVGAPKEVLDSLDAEDGFKIEAVVQSFFPRRTPVQTDG